MTHDVPLFLRELAAAEPPAYAERLAARLADPGYRTGLLRQLSLSVGASVIGLVWGGASFALLLRTDLTAQMEMFWFLCLLLAAGLFVMAQFTLLGSLLSHLAVQRFALGQKDLDIFEATRELHALHESLGALLELTETKRPVSGPDDPLLRRTLAILHEASAPEGDEIVEREFSTVVNGWRARGASEEVLQRLTLVNRVA